MKPKVYIDGKDGTTGLQIYDRLAARDDIDLLLIDEAKRKDPDERKRLMAEADIVFLCLPDAAAVEAVALAEGSGARMIDASTAHRTAPGWVYGFPELRPGQREAIAGARHVANPGCHATGFISIVAPLVQAGLLSADADLCCFSLTGYSGGGKKMIAQYEAAEKAESLYSPGLYGLTQAHKHLPEMQKISGLAHAPAFVPVVCDYYSGMQVLVPLDLKLAGTTAEAVAEGIADYYKDGATVSVHALNEPLPENGLYSNALSGSDRMELYLTVNAAGDQMMLISLFDNLGKGSSGAAVQCMNLMLGLPETEGLE